MWSARKSVRGGGGLRDIDVGRGLHEDHGAPGRHFGGRDGERTELTLAKRARERTPRDLALDELRHGRHVEEPGARIAAAEQGDAAGLPSCLAPKPRTRVSLELTPQVHESAHAQDGIGRGARSR